jgi:hypothetical protein
MGEEVKYCRHCKWCRFRNSAFGFNVCELKNRIVQFGKIACSKFEEKEKENV